MGEQIDFSVIVDGKSLSWQECAEEFKENKDLNITDIVLKKDNKTIEARKDLFQGIFNARGNLTITCNEFKPFGYRFDLLSNATSNCWGSFFVPYNLDCFIFLDFNRGEKVNIGNNIIYYDSNLRQEFKSTNKYLFEGLENELASQLNRIDIIQKIIKGKYKTDIKQWLKNNGIKKCEDCMNELRIDDFFELLKSQEIGYKINKKNIILTKDNVSISFPLLAFKEYRNVIQNFFSENVSQIIQPMDIPQEYNKITTTTGIVISPEYMKKEFRQDLHMKEQVIRESINGEKEDINNKPEEKKTIYNMSFLENKKFIVLNIDKEKTDVKIDNTVYRERDEEFKFDENILFYKSQDNQKVLCANMKTNEFFASKSNDINKRIKFFAILFLQNKDVSEEMAKLFYEKCSIDIDGGNKPIIDCILDNSELDDFKNQLKNKINVMDEIDRSSDFVVKLNELLSDKNSNNFVLNLSKILNKNEGKYIPERIVDIINSYLNFEYFSKNLSLLFEQKKEKQLELAEEMEKWSNEDIIKNWFIGINANFINERKKLKEKVLSAKELEEITDKFNTFKRVFNKNTLNSIKEIFSDYASKIVAISDLTDAFEEKDAEDIKNMIMEQNCTIFDDFIENKYATIEDFKKKIKESYDQVFLNKETEITGVLDIGSRQKKIIDSKAFSDLKEINKTLSEEIKQQIEEEVKGFKEELEKKQKEGNLEGLSKLYSEKIKKISDIFNKALQQQNEIDTKKYKPGKINQPKKNLPIQDNKDDVKKTLTFSNINSNVTNIPHVVEPIKTYNFVDTSDLLIHETKKEKPLIQEKLNVNTGAGKTNVNFNDNDETNGTYAAIGATILAGLSMIVGILDLSKTANLKLGTTVDAILITVGAIILLSMVLFLTIDQKKQNHEPSKISLEDTEKKKIPEKK